MFSLQARQTRLAAFVGVFGGSAMLWITVTSGCFAFVFQQPMGNGLEIRLRGQEGPLGTRLLVVQIERGRALSSFKST